MVQNFPPPPVARLLNLEKALNKRVVGQAQDRSKRFWPGSSFSPSAVRRQYKDGKWLHVTEKAGFLAPSGQQITQMLLWSLLDLV